MANRTESGALAVGAPGSVMRIKAEIEHYLSGHEIDPFLSLISTAEGKTVCKAFAVNQGAGDSPEDCGVTQYCILYRRNFHQFICGFLAGLDASIKAPRG